jgi:hypothetical protein
MVFSAREAFSGDCKMKRIGMAMLLGGSIGSNTLAQEVPLELLRLAIRSSYSGQQ